jgi:hypothetical protein
MASDFDEDRKVEFQRYRQDYLSGISTRDDIRLPIEVTLRWNGPNDSRRIHVFGLLLSIQTDAKSTEKAIVWIRFPKRVENQLDPYVKASLFGPSPPMGRFVESDEILGFTLRSDTIYMDYPVWRYEGRSRDATHTPFTLEIDGHQLPGNAKAISRSEFRKEWPLKERARISAHVAKQTPIVQVSDAKTRDRQVSILTRINQFLQLQQYKDARAELRTATQSHTLTAYQENHARAKIDEGEYLALRLNTRKKGGSHHYGQEWVAVRRGDGTIRVGVVLSSFAPHYLSTQQRQGGSVLVQTEPLRSPTSSISVRQATFGKSVWPLSKKHFSHLHIGDRLPLVAFK